MVTILLIYWFTQTVVRRAEMYLRSDIINRSSININNRNYIDEIQKGITTIMEIKFRYIVSI